MKGLTFVRCGPLGTSLRAHSGEVPVGLISPHARRGGVAVWELYFTGSRSGAEVGSACDMDGCKESRSEDAWVRVSRPGRALSRSTAGSCATSAAVRSYRVVR